MPVFSYMTTKKDWFNEMYYLPLLFSLVWSRLHTICIYVFIYQHFVCLVVVLLHYSSSEYLFLPQYKLNDVNHFPLLSLYTNHHLLIIFTIHLKMCYAAIIYLNYYWLETLVLVNHVYYYDLRMIRIPNPTFPPLVSTLYV